MLRLILLGGFLGAGKTTTMLAAAGHLRSQGRQVAVVTNDQGGRLVDTRVAGSQAGAVGEVTGGCFCCRFEDLATTVAELARGGTDTVIAEAVGSCADLQATVVRPLRRLHGEDVDVAPLTTLVEPARLEELADVGAGPGADTRAEEHELAYLFGRQLEEADVIALNKADTRSPRTMAFMADVVRRAYPQATVRTCSARTGEGLPDLIDAWTRRPGTARDLDIDYERYARAEARLGWLNTDLMLRPASSSHDFDPCVWVRAVLAEVSRSAAATGVLVGHVKLAVQGAGRLVRGSLVAAGGQPDVHPAVAGRIPEAAVVLNARLSSSPSDLEALVRRSVALADEQSGTSSLWGELAAFTPAYPRPVHRMPATQTV